MALVQLPGTSRIYYPFDLRTPRHDHSPSQLVLDASDKKIAIGGRLWHKGRRRLSDLDPFPPEPKNIVRAGFPLGTVNKSSGSNYVVSLQSMVGAPAADSPKPTEIQDQTVSILSTDANYTSNVWYRTNPFNTPRSILHNDRVCVVVEYDAGGRLGSDTLAILGRTAGSGVDQLGTPWMSLKAADFWGYVPYWPSIAFEFDDGTFGTLCGSWPSNGGEGWVDYSSISNPNEYGLKFRLPWTVGVDQIIVLGDVQGVTSDTNFQVNLYQDTSIMTSVSKDGTKFTQDRNVKEISLSGMQTLIANTEYIISVKPTLTNPLRLFHTRLGAAAHRELWGDENLEHVARLDSGPWAVHSTIQIPMMGIRIVAYDDGVGGVAGGIIRHPGLLGGMAA